jgi:hypothetical protein
MEDTMMWAYRLYRAARALVVFTVLVLRALLAAAILAEDLVIQARSCLLAALTERREYRASALPATILAGSGSAPVAEPAASPLGDEAAPAAPVIALEDLRRARSAREESA